MVKKVNKFVIGEQIVILTKARLTTVWGGRLRKRFCKIFSESSTGSWADLQLPCCPSKQGELPENMLQNLLLNLPPQTVWLAMLAERLESDESV